MHFILYSIYDNNSSTTDSLIGCHECLRYRWSIAAFAQAVNVQQVGDLTNAVSVSTGRNSQVNAAETTQLSVNSITADNEAESGDATAIQLFSGVTVDTDVSQTSATVQTNNLDDSDAVTVTQTNVPVHTQSGAIAIDVDAEGLTATELVALIQEILGSDGGIGCSPWDPQC